MKARTAILIVLLVVIAALAACGGGSEPTATPVPTNTATSVPTATAVPTATTAPTATPVPVATEAVEAASPESPLAAPDSPLAAPESPLAPPSVDEAPTPEADKSSVIGRIVSIRTGLPLANTVVRLPEVYCAPGVKEEDKREQCFWALDNAFSPSAISDETGLFVFNNVEVRDYVVMLGDIMLESLIIDDEEGKPVIITTPEGEVLNLGELRVDF